MNQTRHGEVIWSAEEIADLIDRLQITYAAAATALLLLNDDDVLQLLRAKGYDRGTMIRLGRQDNTFYEGINLWDAINLVRQDHRYNLDFLGSYFMTILLFVGDKLRLNDYFDKTPELEFLRHLRNGVSHGNTFRLRDYGEPRRPAICPTSSSIRWIRNWNCTTPPAGWWPAIPMAAPTDATR